MTAIRPILAAAAFLLASCQTRLADFTAISTRQVRMESVDLDAHGGSRVRGTSSRFILLFLPFGLPSLQEAVDDALDQGSGDVVLDAAVYRTGWWFLVGTTTLEVRGRVVDSKRQVK
jgi:hypothetical protein